MDFSEKLTILISELEISRNEKLTDERMVQEIFAKTKKKISPSHFWSLHSRKNINPSLDIIQALCNFFNVPPEYFFEVQIREDEKFKEKEIHDLHESLNVKSINFRGEPTIDDVIELLKVVKLRQENE